MKALFTILIFFFLFFTGFAQIGINTTTPNAMLDISSSTNGLLIPRIALTANNVAAPVVNPQGGALLTSTLIYNTATVAGVNGVSPGYYYWNGTLWTPFTGSISNNWKLTGNSSITTPAIPAIYGTSAIVATENFVGTTDVNDVVIGSNNIERMRFRSTGFTGIGTANPAYKLHISKDTAGSTTTFSENTFVGNTNGTGIYGSSFNNPGYGIGGQFSGGSRGVIAQADGSTSTFTVTGVLSSAYGSGNGFREGGNFSATGVNIANKGIVASAIGGTTANHGGLFSASGGVESYGGQFSATGATTNYAGDFSIFSAATINYGGRFNVFNGAINYAGFFQALGGTKNYAIVVPSGGGTIGLGTITPNAMLDVFSTTNGVLLPRIALTANNVAAPVINPQGGALTTSTMIYNTATVAGINGVSPGYYYWSGTLWIPFLSPISNDWKLTGNTAITTPLVPVTYGTSTIGATENFVGTTDANDVVIGTNNIERFRIKQTTGNVGIGIANPSYKLHVLTKTAGAITALFENTFTGNTSGVGIIGTSVNNPGFGIGGQFFGGLIGLEATANGTTYSGIATGVSGISIGNGGVTASRVGGSFTGSGINNINYGVQGFAQQGTFANVGGIFTSIGGSFSTGADFRASGGIVTQGGNFIATGSVGVGATYGVSASGNGATRNYGGSFVASGSAATNIGGYFSASGGINNYAIIVPPDEGDVGIGTLTPTTKLDIVSPSNTLGLRLLSGSNAQLSYLSIGKATEYAQIGACTPGSFFSDALDGDMAIKNFNSGKILFGASFIANAAMAIIPGGNVGVGTVAPTHKFQVTTGALNTSTAFIENTSTGGIGVEGSALGNFGSGIGGKFTGTSVGVQGNGVPSSGATNVLGGYFNATGSVGNTSYGVNSTAIGATTNYGGAFYAVGVGTTNIAGYFSASNGATILDNKAIIVPPNGGLVGIGTNNPVDQLEVAGGFVRSTGYRCRTGTSGTYPGNTFNINWSGANAQLWIDATNVGTFQFTSDRRLKENIIRINDNALSRVMQLKPVSFNYKNIPNTIFTGNDIVTEGFIADELQEIIPSAVNGEKDGLTKEGKIQPQTLNMSPVVSVLTKAIQEQQVVIEELKSKNIQLEERLKKIEMKIEK